MRDLCFPLCLATNFPACTQRQKVVTNLAMFFAYHEHLALLISMQRRFHGLSLAHSDGTGVLFVAITPNDSGDRTYGHESLSQDTECAMMVEQVWTVSCLQPPTRHPLNPHTSCLPDAYLHASRHPSLHGHRWPQHVMHRYRKRWSQNRAGCAWHREGTHFGRAHKASAGTWHRDGTSN